MYDAFEYAKQKWDKIHKNPELKVGDLILVSTFTFDNIEGPKKLEDSFFRTIYYQSPSWEKCSTSNTFRRIGKQTSSFY
ncbi:hypothetical protein O181_052630, partial [Austropuccinia psidii MF-1]|nr:hypothetical protein [Austropuccinia psidii MF-1]